MLSKVFNLRRQCAFLHSKLILSDPIMKQQWSRSVIHFGVLLLLLQQHRISWSLWSTQPFLSLVTAVKKPSVRKGGVCVCVSLHACINSCLCVRGPRLYLSACLCQCVCSLPACLPRPCSCHPGPDRMT